jgi:hypothetical protein
MCPPPYQLALEFAWQVSSTFKNTALASKIPLIIQHNAAAHARQRLVPLPTKEPAQVQQQEHLPRVSAAAAVVVVPTPRPHPGSRPGTATRPYGTLLRTARLTGLNDQINGQRICLGWTRPFATGPTPTRPMTAWPTRKPSPANQQAPAPVHWIR